MSNYVINFFQKFTSPSFFFRSSFFKRGWQMQVRANRGPRLLNICGAHFEYKLVMGLRLKKSCLVAHLLERRAVQVFDSA